MQTLIVDDSKTMRIIIENTLLNTGLNFKDIYTAQDGIEALSILNNESIPDIQLILLDWNMPKLNGLDFLKKIKSNDKLKSIPVIMITTEGGKSNVIEAIKAGIFDYMIKPFNIKNLQSKIEIINDKILTNQEYTLSNDDNNNNTHYSLCGDTFELNILIVDDSQTMRKVIENRLLDIGIQKNQIHETEDGVLALKYLKTNPIQLILLDWNMPNLNGFEFLKIIKSDDKLKKIPVIMITNEGTKSNIISAIKVGIFDYITKPFSFDKFQDRMDRVIDVYLSGQNRIILKQRMIDAKNKRNKDSLKYNLLKIELDKNIKPDLYNKD